MLGRPSLVRAPCVTHCRLASQRESPLWAAARFEQMEAIDLLLSAGCNVNNPDEAVRVWPANHSSPTSKPLFPEALLLCLYLLALACPHPPSTPQGWTALFTAARWDRLQVVQRLLDAGADSSISPNEKAGDWVSGVGRAKRYVAEAFYL